MTKELIMFSAQDKLMGALMFQAEMMKQLNNIDGVLPASVYAALSKASSETASEIRYREWEQIKKLENNLQTI